MNYQTTKEVEFACIKHVWNGGSYLVIPNVKDGFFKKREADLLVITPSNYLFEIEIKISMADLRKDGQKKLLFVDQFENDIRIKRKIFAVPEELFNSHSEKIIKLIPEYAGLWTIKKSGWIVERISPKNKSCARKISEKEKAVLMRLGCLRLWGIKRKSVEIDSIKKDIRKVLKGEDTKILKKYIEKKKYW